MTLIPTPPPAPAPPPDRDSLIKERDALMVEIQKIESELGQPRHFDSSGLMLDIAEFHEWRRKAKYARTMRVARYREIKTLLAAMAEQATSERAPHGERSPHILESIDARLEAITSLLERILDAQFEPDDVAP